MDLYRINLKSGYQAERLIANGLTRVAPNSLVLADLGAGHPSVVPICRGPASG